MSILISGKRPDQQHLQSLLESCTHHPLSCARPVHPESYDQFISHLRSQSFRAIFIHEAGAAGMESVRAAKVLCPDTPVIWFSDDHLFHQHSQRLSAAYFAVKPICKHHIEAALQCCTA